MEVNKTLTPIHDWANDEQPRYKLITRGTYHLNNSELLSILINTGSKEKSAIDLAKEILAMAKNNLNELGKLSLYDLQKVKGMGVSKASAIIAAIELGRRWHCELPVERVTIRRSSDIASYLQIMLKDYSYEVFAVIFLNRANKIKHFEIISRGGFTGTVADPRMILKKAVELEATNLILTHNHPSGNLMPSKADEELTSKIKHAAAYFDIKILDHLIVSEEGFYSFADEGML